MLVQKGFVKEADIRNLLKKKETSANFLGEFLVKNKLVSQADIDQALRIQQAAIDRGDHPKRLGDILVETGVLRKEEMELFSQRHVQNKRIQTSSVTVVRRLKNAKGKQVRGDFELIRTLGQHIDGITYQSLHIPSGAVVVTHFFNEPDLAAMPAVERDTEAFAKKCEQVQHIHHPASQKVFSFEQVTERNVLVAEFITGATLSEVIGSQEKIDWAWALEIAIDLAEVLMEAEALGITHDDIRPGSILVDTAGKAKLALWAYTEMPQANRDMVALRHGSIPYYFHPDRLSQPAAAYTDMFSLGAALIHAITGQPVMAGTSFVDAVNKYHPAEAVQNLAMDMDLPLTFLSILGKMVDLDPKRRWNSLGELVQALKSFKNEEGLEFSGGNANTLITRAMTPAEAAAKISNFLSMEKESPKGRYVTFSRLFHYYAFPVAIMIFITIVTTIVYRTTQSSQGLMVRANWRDLQGDKAGALSLYSMISEIYPNNPTVQQRYYDLALEMKDHGEAEVALERLMNLHPERRIEYLEMQADLQVWQNRFLSAVDLYREVQQERPNDIKLKLKIANALLWANSFADAQQEFSDLVFLDPNNAAYVLGLARAASGNKDLDTAARMFDRLSRMSALPENVLMEYAWALKDGGRTQELENLAKKVVQSQEIGTYSKRNQTYLYYWADDYASAARLLDELTNVSPNDKEFLQFRININDEFGNVDAMISDYKALSNLEPNNVQLYMTIAQLYQRKKDFKEAGEYLRLALSKNDGDPEIKLAIAENLGYMEDHAAAIRWYREVLDSRPNDSRALKGLVQAMIWNGDYDQALAYVERLYRENPYDRWNRVNLATVYTRTGRGDQALPIIQKLLDDGVLSKDEREMLAINAMAAGDNRLLLQLIGVDNSDSEKLNEVRLVLARRLRAQGMHTMALPLYAAVLANMKNPDPKFLIEASETANWAKRPDIATKWLEMARQIVASRAGNPAAAAQPVLPHSSFLLSGKEWDSLLSPLKSNPDVYKSLSGFPKHLSSEAKSPGGI